MEYNLSKHSLNFCNTFLDTVNEQIVDFDISLPDYCPDIEKILKCTLIPKIHNKHISGGQLTVDGVACVRVLYCDSVRQNIRCYEQTVPFTSNFNLKSTPKSYVVLTNTKCEYINCRALSPRKLLIHGAFSLYVKVLCKESQEIYGFEDDGDLQIKHRRLSAGDLCAISQEQFSVSEDISVSNKPAVQYLLTYSVNAQVTEIKSISNKLMVNFELTVRAMYLCDFDSGDTEHITYVIPLSRIVDCDCDIDNVVNIPYVEVMSYDLNIKNDTLGDNSVLSLDAKLCFTALSYQSKDISVIEDVYSTMYQVDTKTNPLCCEHNHTLKVLTHLSNISVNLDGICIKKVLDVYSQSLTLLPAISNGKLVLSGKLTVCLLLLDDEDTVNYIERTADLELTEDFDSDFDKAVLCNAMVQSISFRLVDDSSVDLRAEIKSFVSLCNSSSANQIVAIHSLEDKPVRKSDSALCLYYADKGESVWDISKAFATKSKTLLKENDIDADELESAMMLLVYNE